MEKITHAVRYQYWLKIVTECNNCCNTTGMKKCEWLKEHNINEKAFFRWQTKFRMEKALEAADQSPVPVFAEAVPSAPVTVSSVIESSSSAVITDGNLKIQLSDDISEELLRKIIRVMADA